VDKAQGGPSESLKSSDRSRLLGVAALLTLALAVFQAAVSFSPPWSLYFGAPESLAARPFLLMIAGLAAAALFLSFALYAAAGAGYVRSLPALRPALLCIGALFTLRGLLAIPLLLESTGFTKSPEALPPTALASSLASLVIGALYLGGTVEWRRLSSGTRRRG
jgi:hypothetical protein